MAELVEAGYGHLSDVSEWPAIKRLSFYYIRRMNIGWTVNWETGEVEPPPAPKIEG